MTNDGTIAPGGSGAIVTTELTGKLTQSNTGTYAVDLNVAGNTADRINVSGAASLSGQVQLALQSLAIGSGTVTILSAAGNTTTNALALTGIGPVIQAQLVYPNPNDVTIAYSVSFAPTNIGLNANQIALGEHINAAVTAGGIAPLTDALLAIGSNAGYQAALDQLSPEVYLDSEVATLFSGLSFANSLLSCRVRDGANAIINEGQCVWAQVTGDFLSRNSTSQNLGFQDDRYGVTGGAQIALAPSWHLNVAGSYQHDDIDANPTSSSHGDSGFGGAALKYTAGPLLLAASVSGGEGSFDTKRSINLPGLSGIATASNDVAYVGGGLRAAYLVGNSAWYAKPLVDLNVTHLGLGDATEQGAGVAGLRINGQNETVWSFSPAIETGGEWRLTDKTLLRPYLRGGVTVFDDTDLALLASFAGAPTGTAPFVTTSRIDRVLGTVSAGIDALAIDGTVLKLSYDGRYGDTIRDSAITGRASFKY